MAKKRSAADTTRWTLIVRAQGAGTEARDALGELVRSYEGFIVWLIRYHGHPPDVSVDDLKQEFLIGLLRRDDIAKLDRHRGSFRGWLTMCVRTFLANEWKKWKTISSGRRITDPALFEQIDARTPEDEICARAFAGQVVLNALSLLRAETRDKERFDDLQQFLPGPLLELVELAPFARDLGMSRTALAKSICVMRARFRALLRETIRDTLDLDREPPDAPSSETSRVIDAEMRALLEAFRTPEHAGVVMGSLETGVVPGLRRDLAS